MKLEFKAKSLRLAYKFKFKALTPANCLCRQSTLSIGLHNSNANGFHVTHLALALNHIQFFKTFFQKTWQLPCYNYERSHPFDIHLTYFKLALIFIPSAVQADGILAHIDTLLGEYTWTSPDELHEKPLGNILHFLTYLRLSSAEDKLIEKLSIVLDYLNKKKTPIQRWLTQLNAENLTPFALALSYGLIQWSAVLSSYSASTAEMLSSSAPSKLVVSSPHISTNLFKTAAAEVKKNAVPDEESNSLYVKKPRK